MSIFKKHWGKLLLLFVFAGSYLSPIGFIAVKIACGKDGGETILSTVFADEYYHKSPYSRCDACMYEVGAGTFVGVDFLIKHKTSHPLTQSPGFNRFSIENIDSDQCKAWRESDEFANRNEMYRLAESECIALMPVEKPTRYQYESTLSDSRGPLVTTIRLYKHEIVDLETGQTLAVYRRYLYIPLLKRQMFEWNGPIWKCEAEDGIWDVSKFRQRVLRDQSKIDQDSRTR